MRAAHWFRKGKPLTKVISQEEAESPEWALTRLPVLVTETLLKSSLSNGSRTAPPTGTSFPGGIVASPPSGHQIPLPILTP